MASSTLVFGFLNLIVILDVGLLKLWTRQFFVEESWMAPNGIGA